MRWRAGKAKQGNPTIIIPVELVRKGFGKREEEVRS
jgi:hypothetical protein